MLVTVRYRSGGDGEVCGIIVRVWAISPKAGEVSRATVIGVEKLNKRIQILIAFDYVTTDIVVLADDDVFWPSAKCFGLIFDGRGGE